MDQTKKRKLIGLSSMLTLLVLVLFTVISTTAVIVNAVINLNSLLTFEVTYSGHNFICYGLDGDDNGVAIAYNGNAEASASESLSIPSEVTDPNTSINYDVKAIARGGFRYCNFNEYVVPQTISQIGEEAFAYNQNLTYFNIPHLVDEIAPSTFLDCTQLANIYYTDEDNNRTFGNDTIKKIGDHAFDSCYELSDFFCPKSVTYFGEACFQRCKKFINFYFPSTIKDEGTGEITNYITVRPYAFAFCSELQFVYFETNVQEIDDYAFVNCNETLSMKYNGTTEPAYYRETETGSVNQPHWRDKNISTNLPDQWPLEIEHPTILVDDDYPCFRYTIQTNEVYLDSANGRRPTVKLINEDATGYAVIYKFDTPAKTIEGCFNVSTGALTIPNTLNGKTVKVIHESTFANHSEIQSVKFNADLVQICHHAFFNCLNISNLDFTSCTKLREVSYYCFQDYTIQNQTLTSLTLPNCLEYIGGYAFSDFVQCNSLVLPNNLQCIADLAFYGLGKSVGTAQIDLLLPKSLNDAAAATANYYNFPSPKNFGHPYNDRKFAVGKYAFHDANGIRTCTMEDDPDHKTDYTYNCSFYSNSFYGASKMFRFKTSSNLCYLGKDAFKNCSGLREIFLTSDKSNHTGHNYPWCIDEDTNDYGGTFFTGTSTELVIYVDGPKAPGLLDSVTITADHSKGYPFSVRWNAESGGAYYNDIKNFEGSGGSAYLSRTRIPTYYGVNFATDIKYWNPKTKAIVNAPVQLNDYNNGIISFVKDVTGKFTVARYYMNAGKGKDIIDLTSVPNISDGTTNLLYKIGDEAFAKSGVYNTKDNANANRDREQGCYFILPDTITEIGERAFFRKTDNNNSEENNGRYATRVVTYKSGDKYVAADGTASLTYAQLEAIFTTINGQDDKLKRGYCVLPDGVTRIGNLAFYNHIFESIKLGTGLTYFGNDAFYTNAVTGGSGTQYPRLTVTSFTIGTNPYFSVINNGVYYIGGGNSKKILMYQSNNLSGTLTIDSGTKAIGFEGCSNTGYTTITLPSGLTTIYGGGLYKNTKLTTVTGVDDLRYIGTIKNPNGGAMARGWDDPDYTEIYDDSVAEHYEVVDYRDFSYLRRPLIESLYGAFAECKKLETIDFTSMSELRRIGRKAFDGCVAMSNMSGSNTYTFKNYNASTKTSTAISGAENISSGVLDLTSCTNLRSLDSYAFGSCSGIKYAIMPDNRGDSDQSKLYIGYDPDIKYLDNAPKQIFTEKCGVQVFISETVFYSHQTYGSSHSASTHYPANCFGKNNQLYYYIGENADIPGSDHTALKYWTYEGDDIIIFNSADDARVYFPAS